MPTVEKKTVEGDFKKQETLFTEDNIKPNYDENGVLIIGLRGFLVKQNSLEFNKEFLTKTHFPLFYPLQRPFLKFDNLLKTKEK